jgi:PleD family two-component response regulator
MTPNLLSRDANAPHRAEDARPEPRHPQLAVFVGGGTDALAYVEPILSGRAYDVEFVDNDDEPYATIAALKPDIVVVSLDMDHEVGFQLLTMLRLDPETAQIPVLSYLREDTTATSGDANVDHSPMRLASPHATRAVRH